MVSRGNARQTGGRHQEESRRAVISCGADQPGGNQGARPAEESLGNVVADGDSAVASASGKHLDKRGRASSGDQGCTSGKDELGTQGRGERPAREEDEERIGQDEERARTRQEHGPAPKRSESIPPRGIRAEKTARAMVLMVRASVSGGRWMWPSQVESQTNGR